MWRAVWCARDPHGPLGPRASGHAGRKGGRRTRTRPGTRRVQHGSSHWPGNAILDDGLDELLDPGRELVREWLLEDLSLDDLLSGGAIGSL